MTRPGTRPVRALETFVTPPAFISSSPFTCEMAPVTLCLVCLPYPTTLAFFCVPYPTTTTSESTVEVSCNVMFSGDFVVASIGTSTLCNPTYEKTRVSPGATSMTY